MTISSSSSNAPQSLNMSLKEGYMRTDISNGKGALGASIMDMKNMQMIILMPQQQMYMVQPIPQPNAAGRPAGAAAGQPSTGNAESLQDTGVKETILGYVCTKYTVTGKNGTAEIWVTDQLGSFFGMPHGGPGGPGGRSQPPQEWENALKGGNFFPMRVISNNGKSNFKMEVTAIDKTSLPDSLFQAPAGWRKFDMGAMMGGMMPGGYPGARPSSGNN